MECADAAHGLNGLVVGDGGCTCPGDVAKVTFFWWACVYMCVCVEWWGWGCWHCATHVAHAEGKGTIDRKHIG